MNQIIPNTFSVEVWSLGWPVHRTSDGDSFGGLTGLACLLGVAAFLYTLLRIKVSPVFFSNVLFDFLLPYAGGLS